MTDSEKEIEYDKIKADMCKTLNNKKFEEIPYAARASFFATALSVANAGIREKLEKETDKGKVEELKWRLQVNDKLIAYLEEKL